MRRVAIVDPGAFGRPVEAASILLPKDWQVEAGVVWTGDIGCPRNGVKLSLKAHSPDGTLGFEVFPDYVWNWVDDPQARAYTNPLAAYGITGCDTLPPYDAVGYLQNLFLPRWRPGATLVGIGQVPELVQAMQMEFLAMSGGQPSPIQTEFDVALAAIETPRAGGTVEEWVLASLVRTVAYLPVLSGMGGFGNQMSGNYTTAAVSQCAARAPKGQLERHEKLFEAIYRSFRLNPAWESAVAQHFLTMERINLKGVQDRQRIMRQSQLEIGAMIEQGYNTRAEIMDRSAERQIRALRGVEAYIDPTTRTRVDLTTGYQGAWTNGLGDYVLSDSPAFNPARELQGNWTALQPERR
ncbi:MAG: hypothetical protein GC183_00540 [Thiobacillus sp.]|nr:hypothetical protein [Thiobacillus sp.]